MGVALTGRNGNPLIRLDALRHKLGKANNQHGIIIRHHLELVSLVLCEWMDVCVCVGGGGGGGGCTYFTRFLRAPSK